MGFQTGIVGLPNVGKSTLFNALTRTAAAQAANYPFCTIEPNVGEVSVPDARLAPLAQISMTEALARAPVSALAAFEYTAMIWALGFDLAIFGQAPSWIKLLGAAMIVGAAMGVGVMGARARTGAVDSSGRTH